MSHGPVMSARNFVFVLSLVASCHALAAGEPQPGLWELTADLAVPSIPGSKQEPIALRQCLTAADARDPSRVLIGSVTDPGATDCKFTEKRESPGHTEFSVRCEGIFAISGKGSVNYTPKSIQGTLDVGFNAGSAGDPQRVESVSHISGKRIGSC